MHLLRTATREILARYEFSNATSGAGLDKKANKKTGKEKEKEKTGKGKGVVVDELDVGQFECEVDGVLRHLKGNPVFVKRRRA
jgi:hypothetical protein